MTSTATKLRGLIDAAHTISLNAPRASISELRMSVARLRELLSDDHIPEGAWQDAPELVTELRDTVASAETRWQARARTPEIRAGHLALLGPAGPDTHLVVTELVTERYVGPPGQVLLAAFSIGERFRYIKPYAATHLIAAPAWAAQRLTTFQGYSRFGMDIYQHSGEVHEVPDLQTADTAAALWTPEQPDSAYARISDAVHAALLLTR